MTGLTGMDESATGDRDKTCATTRLGGVRCWGSGLLGDGGTGGVNLPPADVQDIGSAASPPAGTASPARPSTTGPPAAGGGHQSSQLGTGDPGGSDAVTPVPVSGLTDATQVTAGFDHACALKDDTTVVCWGDDRHGKLGHGTVEVESPAPERVLGRA